MYDPFEVIVYGDVNTASVCFYGHLKMYSVGIMVACSGHVIVIRGYSYIRRLRYFVDSSEVIDNIRLSRYRNFSVSFYA